MIIGPISIAVTLWLPSAITFYFAVAASLGIAQNLLFLQPWFRRWNKLPALPPPEPPKPAAPVDPNAGLVSTAIAPIRDAMKTAREKVDAMAKKGNDKAEFKKEKELIQKQQEEIMNDTWRRMREQRRK